MYRALTSGVSCTNSFYSRHVEKYLAAEAPHKHLVFVLNKIDLVPSKTAVSFDHINIFTLPCCTLSLPGFRQAPGVSQEPSAFHAQWEIIRYIPGRVISTSNFPGLVIRLGIDRLRLGVLSPDTGRVPYELKAATVPRGQVHGRLLSDDSYISNPTLHLCHLPCPDAN
jgi:hypothetical protein